MTFCMKDIIVFFVLDYQANNEISKLEDLSELKSLAVLHLRENQIEKLDGFSEKLQNLQYINMRFEYVWWMIIKF